MPAQSFAQAATQSGITTLQVTVGGAQISLSGFVAPYASVVLLVNNTVLSSTVADSSGNFSFVSIPILKGTTSFCLDSVDYKKLGESEACFTIDPATGLVSKSNIFLPPTLGVYRTDVNVGDKALAWGYGMPGAQIMVHLSTLATCTATADKTGYYQCSILIQKAGSYELKADSILSGQKSEKPMKGVMIQGLSLQKQGGTVGEKGPGNIFTNLPGGIIPWLSLIGLILLILLLILLRKFKPQWFPKVKLGNPMDSMQHAWDSLFRERNLHHSWMKGVGY